MAYQSPPAQYGTPGQKPAQVQGQQGYGAPPPGQYGAPPPQQGGYGAPPQGQGQYGGQRPYGGGGKQILK